MQFENIINRNPAFIITIDNPSVELCILAVSKNPELLQYIQNQTFEVCQAAINRDYNAFRYVRDQTIEICLASVQRTGYVLQFVKDQTIEICLAVVQQNGHALQFVKDQTIEICLAAVQQNGKALQFVKDQNIEICLAAVQQNGYALQYVKNQTVEICLAAIRNSRNSITLINEIYMLEVFNEILNNDKYDLSDDVKGIVKIYCSKHNTMIDILYINCKDRKNEIVSDYNSVEKFIHAKFKDISADGCLNKRKYETKKEIYDDSQSMGLFYVNKNNGYCVYKKIINHVNDDGKSRVNLEKICECYQIDINNNTKIN